MVWCPSSISKGYPICKNKLGFNYLRLCYRRGISFITVWHTSIYCEVETKISRWSCSLPDTSSCEEDIELEYQEYVHDLGSTKHNIFSLLQGQHGLRKGVIRWQYVSVNVMAGPNQELCHGTCEISASCNNPRPSLWNLQLPSMTSHILLISSHPSLETSKVPIPKILLWSNFSTTKWMKLLLSKEVLIFLNEIFAKKYIIESQYFHMIITYSSYFL